MNDVVAEAERLAAAARAVGHEFRDAMALSRALTHASWCGAQATARERLERANERLEFLGDALLGAALCVGLMRRLPDAAEGELSRRKAQLASRATLARLADRLGIAAHARMGAQMSQPWPDSVKANLMESVLAAVFVDGGWDACVAVVERWYGDLITEADAAGDDPKTRLQEWALANGGRLPVYASQRSGGADHDPQFAATVAVGERTAAGGGGSRRKAEAAAAAALLAQIDGDGTAGSSAPTP